MAICAKCQRTISDEEEKELRTALLCEDCYIDAVMPKMGKASYHNDAEFMNRLKDSYIAFPQRYH